MSSIAFTISGLIFNILLIVVYFSKKRIDMLENKIYTGLIISTFFSSLSEIFSYIIVKNKAEVNSVLYIFSIKFLYIFFLLWISLFTLYIIATGRRLRNMEDKKILSLVPIIIIISVVLIFLPIEINSVNGLLLPSGLCTNMIYLFASLCIVTIFISIIRNSKVLNNKEFYPLYLAIVVFSFIVLLQKLIPDLFLINLVLSFITFVMYFTIENPDMRMIEQLNIAKDQADKANRAKSDFLSSMSHEIRTPLNAIVGLSEDISTFNDLPDQVKEDSMDIINASNTLLEIVGNILDINKIESSKMEIIERPYNFKKEIEMLAKVDSTRIGDKKIDFNIKLSEDIPYELLGDKVHMKEIVNNLLSNAFKYTNEGKVLLDVKCVNNNDICNLIITVEDTGIGIKKEKIDKLFTKFERLDVERNTTIEGTGLGLAITKKLVELMGGKIVCNSEYQKGTKFICNIPQKISRLSPPIEEINESKEIIHKDHSGKKILIVDDNLLNIKVAKRSLDNLGLILNEVMSGKECLEKVKNEDYDLILMDIMMPEMSGETTLEELKKDKAFTVPVIALTADALSGAKEKYIKEGFVDYIAKPFSKEEILIKLDKYL